VTCFKCIVALSLLCAPVQAFASTGCMTNLSSVFTQGQDYFESGQYLLSTQQLSMVSLLACEQDLKNQARLKWGQALFELEERAEGLKVLEGIKKGEPLYRESQIVKAWYNKDFVSSLEKEGQSRFDDYNKRIDRLSKFKNPLVAGSLSAVLPGAGQFYNGHYQSAALAFLLNALFLATTLEFEREGLGAAALTSGVLFSVVYVGNIFGAAHGSKGINQNRNRKAEQRIRTEMFPEL
jgi:hypothetical protein